MRSPAPDGLPCAAFDKRDASVLFDIVCYCGAPQDVECRLPVLPGDRATSVAGEHPSPNTPAAERERRREEATSQIAQLTINLPAARFHGTMLEAYGPGQRGMRLGKRQVEEGSDIARNGLVLMPFGLFFGVRRPSGSDCGHPRMGQSHQGLFGVMSKVLRPSYFPASSPAPHRAILDAIRDRIEGPCRLAPARCESKHDVLDSPEKLSCFRRMALSKTPAISPKSALCRPSLTNFLVRCTAICWSVLATKG